MILTTTTLIQTSPRSEEGENPSRKSSAADEHRLLSKSSYQQIAGDSHRRPVLISTFSKDHDVSTTLSLSLIWELH